MTPLKVFMRSLWPDQGKELQKTFVVVDDSSVWLLLIHWDKTWIQKTGALMILILCRPQLICVLVFDKHSIKLKTKE